MLNPFGMGACGVPESDDEGDDEGDDEEDEEEEDDDEEEPVPKAKAAAPAKPAGDMPLLWLFFVLLFIGAFLFVSLTSFSS